jgi:dienelactone hydrolase
MTHPLTHTITIGPTEDLGTRTPFIRALNRRMAKARSALNAHWIARPQEIPKIRERILAGLSYQPRPVPFAAKLLSQTRHPGCVQQVYSLRISPDDETQAVLVMPEWASAKRPAPVLLGLHEHGGQFLLGWEKLCPLPRNSVFKGYQDICYGGQPPAHYFAQNGFAVFAIDHIGFGKRAQWQSKAEWTKRHRLSPEAEQDARLRIRYEHLFLHRALLVQGLTEADIVLHDNRRSIDFLETLPQLDTGKLGCFGLSVGAWWAHQIAGLDTRIKASARVCWSAQMEPMIEKNGPRVMGVQFLMPGLFTQFHVPEWIALSYPNPVLILNGRQDSMYSLANAQGTRRSVMQMTRQQGAPNRVQWSFFDGPHSFHPPEQAGALAFFQSALQA